MDSCIIFFRWNPNGKSHKTGNQNINSSNSNISSSSDNASKNHRKGSMQAFQNIQMYNNYGGNNHNANKNSKSSSYPNFMNPNQHQLSNNQRSSSRDKLHVLIQQQQEMQSKKQQSQQTTPILGSQMNPNAPPYHRNSLNLMNQHTLLQIQQQFKQPQNNCGSLGGSLKSLSSNSSSSNHGDGNAINTTYASSLIGNSNSIGDINSRLESLCRQMTEQAIN